MNVFLIAEIGINHNGDLSLAKKLINSASDAGFDAVKFQKRNIEKVYTKEFLDSPRESPWGKTQRDQKKGLEFEKKEYDEINEYCKNNKKFVSIFISLKKSNSVNIFKIKTKLKVINETKNKDLINISLINFV